MTFWLISAGLVLLGLTFLWIPLRISGTGHAGGNSRDTNLQIYRDRLLELDHELASGALTAELHARARSELEQSLLRDVDDVSTSPAVQPVRNTNRIFLVALGVMPALTLGLYLYLGAPAVLEAQPLTQARGKHDVDAMLSALEAKLKANPGDAESWYVLGRSYLALERQVDAEAALFKAVKLSPKEARMLSQYAEVLAMKNGNLEGQPLVLVNEALELDFQDEKALELAGLAAFQRQDWAQSAHYWRQLLKRLPVDTEFHQDISKVLQDAEYRASQASGLGDKAKLQAKPKKANPH